MAAVAAPGPDAGAILWFPCMRARPQLPLKSSKPACCHMVMPSVHCPANDIIWDYSCGSSGNTFWDLAMSHSHPLSDVIVRSALTERPYDWHPPHPIAGDTVAKNPAAGTRDTSSSSGREDPPEKEMTAHSSILARRIPRTEEPGRPQSMGLQRVRQDWTTEHPTWTPLCEFSY